MTFNEWLQRLTNYVQESYVQIPDECNRAGDPMREGRAMLLDAISAVRTDASERDIFTKGRVGVTVLQELEGYIVVGTERATTMLVSVSYLSAYRVAVELLFSWSADFKTTT